MIDQEVHQFLEENKNIHAKVLEYIDNEENIEERYQNLINLFNELKIRESSTKLKLILRIIKYIIIAHKDFGAKLIQF